MPNLEQPPAEDETFDRWYSQLQQAGELYQPAWEQFAEAIREQRAALQTASSGVVTIRQSRLPAASEDYLSVLEAIAGLIANAPGHNPLIRQIPARERRIACRYPIRTGLDYRVMAGGEVVGTGWGLTINMSSTGILFESERALPAQRLVQLSLDWPGRPSRAVTVRLHVAGRTVRCQGDCTAVAIQRHEFRIEREAAIPLNP